MTQAQDPKQWLFTNLGRHLVSIWRHLASILEGYDAKPDRATDPKPSTFRSSPQPTGKIKFRNYSRGPAGALQANCMETVRGPAGNLQGTRRGCARELQESCKGTAGKLQGDL